MLGKSLVGPIPRRPCAGVPGKTLDRATVFLPHDLERFEVGTREGEERSPRGGTQKLLLRLRWKNPAHAALLGLLGVVPISFGQENVVGMALMIT